MVTPLYKYVAKGLDAKKIKGEREAANEEALAAYLRTNAQFLIEVEEVEANSTGHYRPKANELAYFAEEVGTMLAAGITLVRAMNIILQSKLKPKLRLLYQNVYMGLQKGLSFSEALESQGGAFPDLMVSIFRAGEASGTMDKAAQKVAAQYQKDYKMQSKIKSALTYPAILVVVSLVVMLVVFVFILPTFFDTFLSLNIPMPTITKIVIAISNTITQQWVSCLLGFLIALLISTLFLQIPRVQFELDKMKQKLPIIGPLLQVIYTARFARTLSTLYSSGVSMIQALNVVADTVGNRYIAGQFEGVIAKIRSGEPLSESLKPVIGFDQKLVSVLLIGEETGKLDEMLNSMADSFDFESERAMDRLVALLEPALIVFLAVIIGSIMLAVMLPLFSLYQNMG